MNKETTAYISEKKLDKFGNLCVTLRNPFTNKFEFQKVQKDNSRFNQVENLPLETLVDFNEENVSIISESRIAERTDLGDFQFGSIRDYVDREDQTNRHLLLRDPLYVSIQKIRTNFLTSITSYLTNNGFEWITPSIFTKATEACEDISGLFWTDYQNETTGINEDLALAQTAQLHLEAMNASFGNVFSLAPSFRNEKGSPTVKHLLEYWHLEAEILNTPLEGLMDFLESMIHDVFRNTLTNANGELTVLENAGLGFNQKYITTVLGSYDRITYDEAISKLKQEKFESKETGKIIEWGEDLDSRAETIIGIDKPVFVYNWPDKLKAFYFTRFDDGGRILAKSVDLIGPRNINGISHGEIIGGGEREHRYDEFKVLLDRQVEAIIEHNHDPKDYKYYEDLRMIGTIPHTGFGAGMERMMAFCYNLLDVRMASLFPRDQKRVYP